MENVAQIVRNNPHNREAIKQELMALSEKLKHVSKGGNIPVIGDTRYSGLPHKRVLDDLRVKSYEGRDLSINYKEVTEMFNNDFHLYGNTYFIRGRIPYTIMFEQLYDFSKPDLKPTLLVRLHLASLFDKTVDLLVDFIEEYAGSPVNFVYTDRRLDEVSIARIGTKAFSDYYDFFYRFFDAYDDNFVKNVVYIGKSLTEGVPQAKIDKVNDAFLEPFKGIIARSLSIDTKSLDIFNEVVKTRIMGK